ncbi:cytochrome P450 [Aspergillus heteromorphus CBS 117.55]|uniref:Cytochrome P450 n=1 Tax=Aspergillus heteromorphus CBS 117.55 TaxID=1448321 RepID=A0A317WTW1_9EURO|nr:cytochrome P450 [Aspergillus heteromorphus CBS 117.55]PWY89786.1 cytochrome P450 [Aspergillus heteromorphus CBS 117.55]
MHLPDLFNSASYIVLFALAVQIGVAIYRLTLHPLAKFPGPKLAAASELYGIYYDIWKKGKYVKRYPGLHKKYGPIVRTHPNEIHVFDTEAYNTVFRIGTPFDKQREFYDNPFGEGSHFNMSGLKPAKARRDMLAPHFSTSAIREIEPLLRQSISKFVGILRDYAQGKSPVDLTLGLHCLTTDITMGYVFGKPFEALDAPGFKFEPVVVMDDALFFIVIQRTFHAICRPIMSAFMRMPVVRELHPLLAAPVRLQDRCRQLVLDLINRSDAGESRTPTVFDTMLSPSKEKGQETPSVADLTAEAMVLLIAGEETTANTLMQGIFHVLHDQTILERLQKELREAFPDDDDVITQETLESMPYLRGVVKESLRFSHGAPGRLPRVTPACGAKICGQYIPPGTPISMCHFVYNTDETIFSDPFEFRPERWLGDDFHHLDRHLISFSRGSRGCIGITLGYAELYLILGHIFRKLNLDLYNTTKADMEWDDLYAAKTQKHLEVMVSSA